MRAGILALVAFGSVCCAQVNFQGVVSGYVLDARTNAVRPVLGIPGAAYLGNPLALPFGVTAAAVRGRADTAIVLSDEQPRRAYVLHALNAALSAVVLDAAIPDSDAVYLSNDGSTAAIVAMDRNQVQIVTNLRAGPSVSDPVALDLRGKLHAAAVSNSGCVLFGASGDSSGQLLKICASQPGLVVTMLDQAGFRPSAIAWLSDRQAAVTDAASNQLMLVPMDGGAPRILLDRDGGIESPVGVAVLDSSTVAVANAGGQTLVIAKTGSVPEPRTVPLPVPPDRLETLDNISLLLSNTLSDFPLQLVDSRQDYAVFFVPLN